MNITKVGFIPTTLVDYPGELASVIFLPGCNFRCPYCHNPSLVRGDDNTLVSIDFALNRIEERKNRLTGVVITGGEPTLYPDLPNLINTIKAMGLKVKLDTNGSNPEALKRVLPDYIAMDIKTSPEKYFFLGVDSFNPIKESINYLSTLDIDFELRTTVAPIIFTEDDLRKIVPFIKKCSKYYITGFKRGDILNKEYNLNTPYSYEELEKFKKICHDAGIPCTIR